MDYKSLYGYTLKSDLPLTYLRDAGNKPGIAGTINIRQVESVPEIEKPLFENKYLKLAPDCFHLDIPDVAEFYAGKSENSFEILYQPVEQRCNKNIAAFIMGTVMGGILHLHHRLSLHAATVNYDRQSFMIAGQSGAGKSSALAELLKYNTRFVCDDVSVIDEVNGEFSVAPGHANIRLWKDAAKKSGYKVDDIHQIRPQDEKFWIPMPEKFHPSTGRPESLFILENERTTEVIIQQISGPLKVKYLQAFNFRNIFLRLPGRHKSFFRQAARLADKINVYVVKRPEGYHADKIAGSILEVISRK